MPVDSGRSPRRSRWPAAAAHPLALAVTLLAVRFCPLPSVHGGNPRGLDEGSSASCAGGPSGPFRGGRTKAATGVRGKPGLFYIGVVDGGVWKTTDYGRTWQPVFDDQPTGSIGAIAVAPSNPEVIYVGSGEGMQRPDLSTGDGVYKSVDAGRTWRHLGLRDGQQISQIVVDPKDEKRLFVAVLGHPYGPNEERGVFRSTDGGETFQKVLYVDENTGAADVALDPADPATVYAVLWESRQGPWENGAFTGEGSGLFKSTDGGRSWRPIRKGLPTFAEGLGRIGITIAPSEPRRLYATVEARDKAGIYRSDDAGETWSRTNADPRVVARLDDAAEVRVHPTDPDVLFVPTVVAWKSTDGGKTFTAFRGAPGGDDYQRIWIDPDRPEVMILSSDQGAVVTANGGETWSSWYNQPTAQFYHVSADNSFPYRVCGGQQESGSACVQSRGDDGRITFREWHPVGVEEYGYVAPDPLDPDVVYGGKVSRYDRHTGQVQNVSPHPLRGPGYRVIRTQPVLFSPTDPRALYFASNTLLEDDGRRSRQWRRSAPDLTREGVAGAAERREVPETPSRRRPSQRGVDLHHRPVAARRGAHLGRHRRRPRPRDAATAGRAGRTSRRPQLVLVGQGLHPRGLALRSRHGLCAAVNHLPARRPAAARLPDARRRGDLDARTPGIPRERRIVNAVREDPKRRDLLYAGTERRVWRLVRRRRPLAVAAELNMPATSVRDLVVKDDDLVVGTHGRGFWILDDVTPLRQVDGRWSMPGRTSSPRGPPSASAGTRTPTRRCPRTSPRPPTRPTAR